MRYGAIASLFLAVATGAAASDHGVKTTLHAYASPGGPLRIELEVTNHGERNICFFIEERFVTLNKDTGTVSFSPTGGLNRSDVKAVWNDGRIASFEAETLAGSWATHEDARHVVTVGFDFVAYDCVTLFSHPPGAAPVLFKRKLSTAPAVYD